MKKHLLIFLFLAISALSPSQAQKLLWNVDMEAFLDNREYKNEFQSSESLLGVKILPEIGVGFSEHHALRVGLSATTDLGSTEFVDYLKLTLHYTFDYAPFKLDVGLFSRRCVTDIMPRALMYDSLSYYRPTMGGLYWQFYNKWATVDVWLDWMGRLTKYSREDFAFGSSARFRPVRFFYAGWNGYLHHSTGNKKLDTDTYRPLTENAVYLIYAGIDLSDVTPFEKLYLDGGYLGSYTRVRGANPMQKSSSGLHIRFGMEWQGIGVENVYYTGGDMMPLWDTYGSELYMGDPYYRNSGYNRTDLYIKLIKTSQVDVSFDFSLHAAQGTLGCGQLFRVSVNLGDYNIKKRESRSGFIWQRWLRKS
ncbi:MAG: hypothetical protein RSC07_00980 [Mucinivorans sp.]